MGYTLSDLLVDALAELGTLTISKVTSGTMTTLVDTRLNIRTSRKFEAIIILDTTDGNAPKGEFVTVDLFNRSTDTFDLTAPGLSVAVEAGDTYAYVETDIPLFQAIQAINMGMRKLGPIGVRDESITTVAGQSEYDYPTELKNWTPISVWIQTKDDDVDDNRWQEIHDFRIIPAAPGLAGSIEFQNIPVEGKILRILGTDHHPELEAFDDAVSESVERVVAKWAAAVQMLQWIFTSAGGRSDPRANQLNIARRELDRELAQWPIWMPKKKARLFTFHAQQTGLKPNRTLQRTSDA